MPILRSVGETTETESRGDQNRRLRHELSRELATALERLAQANADVQEVATTAMDLARRLDDSEDRVVLLRAELDELRGGELMETRSLSVEQAATIASQRAYIQRLREQIGRPERLLAKKLLGPVTKLKSLGR